MRKHRILASSLASLSLTGLVLAGCSSKAADPPASSGYYSGDFKTKKPSGAAPAGGAAAEPATRSRPGSAKASGPGSDL